MRCATWMFTLGITLASVSIVWGCSCMPAHPQEHYCNSDFVILARIKREFTYNDTRVYKTRIRKEFKMSEKAKVALKSGRILTAFHEESCGKTLEPGKLYVLSGRVWSLKAHINFCGFNQPWDTITKRQRKGLTRMYRLGCTCQVRRCNPNFNCHRSTNFCNWSTWDHNIHHDCQGSHGICLRSASRHCIWVRNKAQAECMKNITTPVTYNRRRGPLTISL